MKRLLAIFLSLTMLVSAAPLNALAASDNSLSQTITVHSQPDADLVQAIASDPFLTAQADSAPMQEQSATVGTSNVSMEATNGFGKLLLDGMDLDGENGSNFSSGNRVIGITMNGSTATVKYVAEEDAELVVAVYADSTEEEQIASGSVPVVATGDDAGSATATVAIVGEIPEHYTVKGFLLDRAEHAPLCEEYTNAMYTETMEELEDATIDDFDPARTINLDDDRTTNFGVVKQGVVLVQDDELENGIGENIVVLDDSENMIYRIENASAELLNLRVGNIIVYKYSENGFIIAHVADFTISGTTVTIYGDQDFQLEDVFSILKMDGENTTDEATVDTTTGDSEVSYLGTQELETLESTNDWEEEAEFSHVFKISTDDDKEKGDDSKENPFSASITGTVSIKAAIKVKLRVHSGDKAVSVSLPLTENFDLKGSAEFKKGILKFPEITVPIYGCLSVGFEPQFVFKADASVSFNMNSTQTIGFEWSEKNGAQDISEAPVTSINFKLSGSVYLGLDLCPKAKLGAGKVSLLELKFKAEAGFEISGEERLGNQGTGQDEIHSCTNCYEAELKFKLTFGIGLKILFYEPQIDLSPFSYSFGKAYASVDYGDFGWGACPHVKYRLTLKAGETGAGATVKIQSNDSSTSSLVTETTLDADGNSTIYLPARGYLIIADKGNMKFTKTFSLSKAMTLSIDLKQESTGGNPGTTDPDNPDTIDPIPDPDRPGTTKPNIPTGGTVIASGSCGKNEDNKLNWTLDSNGVLTISGSGSMMNYDSTEVPWAENRDKIKYLIVKEGVGGLGNRAFADCTQLAYVSLPDSLMGMGYVTFSGCTSLTQIEIPKNVRSIGAHDFNGSGLTSVVIPDNITSIESGAFYFCENLTTVDIAEGLEYIEYNVFQNSKNLTGINIPSTVKRIGRYSFDECESLQGINYNGTKTQWNQIEIGETVNLHIDRPLTDKIVHCTDGDIVPGEIINSGECGDSLKWVLDSNGVLTIGGTGKMQDYSSTTDAPWNADKDKIKYAAIRADVTSIGSYAFKNCNMLEAIVIPDSVTTIGIGAFFQCDSLKDISYNWRQEAWNKIEMEEEDNISWIKAATIHCTDGDIVPTAENSITSGKTTTDNTTLHAVFNGLTAGEDYAVIVSKSAENPLDAANLIYINQKTAGADGVLDVPFISSESGAAYVVACRKGGSTNPGGNTGKDDSGSTSKPGSDTTKPSTPEQPSSSGGGGGAIVAVVLIGGAAAAVTAGVILMMPVEVSGVAQLGDGNVLANANVQLMKDGQQVAQTTTDESGHFALEVKRGEYQMNVTTVNPETGEQTVRTASVKAPAKNTNFVF